jgi:hypothetical protein
VSFEGARAALGEAVFRQGIRYLADDPERNLVNLAAWGATVARDPVHKRLAQDWVRMFSDEHSNWRDFAVKLIRRTLPEVRDKLWVNFFINATILSPSRRKEAEEKHGVHVPWTILIDPTGRCNLKCKGCWASEYDRSRELDYSRLDRLILEAEDLGIRFFVVSGGDNEDGRSSVPREEAR